MSHVTIKLLDDIGRQVFFVGQHCNLGYFNSLGIFYMYYDEVLVLIVVITNSLDDDSF